MANPDSTDDVVDSSLSEDTYVSYVHPDQISRYSTLTDAVGPYYIRNLPSPPVATTSSLVTAVSPIAPAVTHTPPVVRYREEFVPSPPYSRRRISHGASSRQQTLPNPQTTILFDPISTPLIDTVNCNGTFMTDCISGVGLRDPHTRLFGSLAERGETHFTFALMWPGYEDLDWLVEIPIYGRTGLIKRRELAYFIAHQFEDFIWRCDMTPYNPTTERWRVGIRGYSFEKMMLSALWNVEDRIWQASVRVLTECWE